MLQFDVRVTIHEKAQPDTRDFPYDKDMEATILNDLLGMIEDWRYDFYPIPFGDFHRKFELTISDAKVVK